MTITRRSTLLLLVASLAVAALNQIVLADTLPPPPPSLSSSTLSLSSSSPPGEDTDVETSSFETVIVVEKNKDNNEVDVNGEDDLESDEDGDDVRTGNNFIKSECRPGPHDVTNPYPNPDAVAPSFFTVKFPTTVGLVEGDADVDSTSIITTTIAPSNSIIVMEVNRSWAPLGVDRFHSLLEDHYYDCAAFFRVVPNFVVQFGIAAEPDESSKWGGKLSIVDDPVVQSNTKGTVSFATAGQDTRTTQIFVNLRDNSRLDEMGFAPFAKVTPESLEVLERIYNPTPTDAGGADQGMYEDEGNEWILKEYPDIDIVMGSPSIKHVPEEEVDRPIP